MAEKITAAPPAEALLQLSALARPSFALPLYNEIPNVGLFLEQVSKYINEYLQPLGQPELTGSMISNYVKKGILSNPVKKQYSREQIADLMLIAIAKMVLSLEDIAVLLKVREANMELQSFYTFFRQDFAAVLDAVFENRANPDLVEAEDESTMAVTRLYRMVSVAAAHKIYLDLSFCALGKQQKTNV